MSVRDILAAAAGNSGTPTFANFVNSTIVASGLGAITVDAVTLSQAGDLIVLVVQTAAQTPVTPSGYTLLRSVSRGTAGSAGSTGLYVYTRLLTAADTTTSIADTGDHTTAVKLAYRNAHPDAPVSWSGTYSSGTGQISKSSPTSVEPFSQVLYISSCGRDVSGGGDGSLSTLDEQNATGFTRLNAGVSDGAGGTIEIYEARSYSGEGPNLNTSFLSGTYNRVAVHLAIRGKPVSELQLPALVGSTTGSSSSSLGLGAIPSTQYGDRVFIVTESQGQPVTAPSGYTKILSTSASGTGGSTMLNVFTRLLSAADTSTSIVDPGNHILAVKMAYRGVSGYAIDSQSTFSNKGIEIDASMSLAVSNAIALVLVAADLTLNSNTNLASRSAGFPILTSTEKMFYEFTSLGSGGHLYIYGFPMPMTGPLSNAPMINPRWWSTLSTDYTESALLVIY